MSKINYGRVILGGVLWTLVYNVIGAACWFLFLKQPWIDALAAIGIKFQETAEFGAIFIGLTFLVGVISTWLYAAIRPRYGAGPVAAIHAGVAVWMVGLLLPMILWALVLSLPWSLVCIDAISSLVGIIAATLAAGWQYKED